VSNRDWAFTAMLAATVVGSAVLVVQTKHENRTLVHQLEELRQEKARLETEWAQLQLEEATLAHHGRIEAIARARLGMRDPVDTQIVRTPVAEGSPHE
jgi:cell division protein FtsL